MLREDNTTLASQLASFVVRSRFEDLDGEIRRQIKIRVLDSLGCAIGAVGAEPVHLIRTQIDTFDPAPLCGLIGGGATSPDQAAFYNSALVRYLDFNDSYLAPGETCHPSDNLGAVLAAVDYRSGSGKDLMTALAVAYQVQCRLSEAAPVRARGFDHTTQGAYAVAAGVSKGLGLSPESTANALAVSGTALNALRVTRTGALSHWKGLAYPATALFGTYLTFLAMRGITGPPAVFEGNKGFMESVSGPFELDWSRETLDRLGRTVLKKYNAEVHSQSVLEGIQELRSSWDIAPADIDRVDLDVFDVAYHIIGGGEEGDKKQVRTKEEADHSLPYLAAAALLDGTVMPDQYRPERIVSEDVQALLRKVHVHPRDDLSRRFPREMPCRVTVRTKGGREFHRDKSDYEGFHTHPMHWETVVRKFEGLSRPYADDGLRGQIVGSVADLESIQVRDLMHLLSRVQIPDAAATEASSGAFPGGGKRRNPYDHEPCQRH